MHFRTNISIAPAPFQFSHRNRIFLAGSCFAEKMQHFFTRSGFLTKSNSHGIIFDPMALANAMTDVLNHKVYVESDVQKFENRFLSLAHHGSFSNTNVEILLGEINSSIQESADFLNSDTVCFFTFGNANAFVYSDSGQNVANCHRLPGSCFHRKMYSASEIVEEWKPIILQLQKRFPGMKIVFTVSPVRYLKEGMIKNQISKSNLLLAAHELCDDFENCYYFPAYEIQMDDLRDYRFYADDMVHPSVIAQKYIWQKVLQALAADNTSVMAEKIYHLMLISDHRPRNEEDFEEQLIAAKSKLENLLREADSIAKVDQLIERQN